MNVLPDGPTARRAVTSALRAVSGFAWASRWSAQQSFCDHWEHRAKLLRVTK